MNEDYEEKNIRLDDYGDGSGPKSSRWKFFFAMLGIILSVVGLYAVANLYTSRQGREQAQVLTNNLKQAEEDIVKQQMADTNGGKTPQETLLLYIDAIEKRDYELASKYFILENQKYEINLLNNADAQTKSSYLALLKNLSALKGVYSADGKSYSIPVNDKASVNFIVYPSGVWKIKS